MNSGDIKFSHIECAWEHNAEQNIWTLHRLVTGWRITLQKWGFHICVPGKILGMLNMINQGREEWKN